MATETFKDAGGATKHRKTTGAGTSGDPAVTHTIVDSSALPTGAATSALQGALTETAPATDTASSGLNGRLQRIAQRLTSLIALLPAALGANGGLKIEGVASGTPVPISGSITATQSPPVNVSATPTISTTAYASGDVVGGLMTFTGAGAAGTILTVVVTDKDAESAALELWLFDASITPAADNAAHSISDADLAKCVGVMSLGPYYAEALGSVSVTPAPGITFVLPSGTSLFGLLVARSTPTFTSTTDLTVRMAILP